MSTKLQAILAAIFSAVTGYVAYFIALPPSLQTGILGDVIALAPAGWQPAVASITKTLSTVLGFYATYKAAHSGPSIPTQALEERGEKNCLNSVGE